MRKGAKRKPIQKENKNDDNVEVAEEEATIQQQQQNHKQKPTKRSPPKTTAATKAKRVKASKPQPEPEYFEDQRNLEDLWKVAFPVGTEWDQLEMLDQFNWNFSNLEDAFEEGGVLHGKKVYLFGCTEPQLVKLPNKDEMKVICIPAVVAIVSPFPPSDKIGINSVQREAEEIVPMKQMKMDWVPYIPLENRDSQVDRLKSQIFILSCTQRKTALRHLKIDRVKKYEYCLPYFFNPLKEDELEQSTVVPILFETEPKPVVCEFDWDMDDYEDFTNDLIQAEELSEDQKEAFKEYVMKKVKEAKKANREARESRKKTLEEMNEETRRAYESIRFYKFYPVQAPETPDISNVKRKDYEQIRRLAITERKIQQLKRLFQAPFINRYYGKAHEVL